MASPHRGIFSVFLVFVSVRPSVCLSPPLRPAGFEALPAGSETVPAGSETLPGGSETLPEVSTGVGIWGKSQLSKSMTPGGKSAV